MTGDIKRTLDLDTALTFGKHRGRTVEDVLEDDPGYLLWLMEEDAVEVDDALKDAIQEAAAGRRR